MALVQHSLRSALRRMRTKPLRAMLTLLQLVLGTLAMTVAINLYLSETSQRGRGEMFSVSAMTADTAGKTTFVISFSTFREQDLSELLELAPDVQALSLFVPGAYRPQVEVSNDLFILPRIAEVSSSYFEMMDIELARGSFFTREEAAEGANVIVLSAATATALFDNAEALGQELTVRSSGRSPRRTYRVIGTFRDREVSDYDSGRAFVHAPAYVPAPISGASSLLVLTEPGVGATAREQIVTAARQRYSSVLAQGDFHIDEPDQPFRFASSLNPNVFIFGLFGIVAFILGAIGIFSQAVVDVTERTREIGVRRALGASRLRISLEFMTEASTLAFLGGLVGVMLAALFIPLLGSWVSDDLFSGITLSFKPLASLAVLGGIVIISAFLGLFPAWRAGSLYPTEALREG